MKFTKSERTGSIKPDGLNSVCNSEEGSTRLSRVVELSKGLTAYSINPWRREKQSESIWLASRQFESPYTDTLPDPTSVKPSTS